MGIGRRFISSIDVVKFFDKQTVSNGYIYMNSIDNISSGLGGLGTTGIIIVSVLSIVWTICAYVAVLLLPFILFRFYRALGLYNRTHSVAPPSNMSAERKEPVFMAEGETE